MARTTGTTASTTTSEKVVKYVGTSDVRKILKGDWSSIEIEQDAVEWSARNKFTVPASELSEAAINYLNDQDDFVVVDPSATKPTSDS